MFGTIGVTLSITNDIVITSMVADIVEDSEIKTGRRSEGLFFAARSLVGKAATGLGGLVGIRAGVGLEVEDPQIDPVRTDVIADAPDR